MVNVRGAGRIIEGKSGSGRSTSSNVATLDHLWYPWDSPTGLKENGGVAKLEFVDVRDSALGEVEVNT